MKQPTIKQLLRAIKSAKQHAKSLEDLQYNLSIFLNEDIYLNQIEKHGKESMLILKYLLKTNVIFVAAKNERILLTPLGESLLVELNNMLLYI